MKVSKIAFSLALNLYSLKKRDKYLIANKSLKSKNLESSILSSFTEWDKVYQIIEKANKLNIKILSYFDYPDMLLNTYDYPFALFYKGNIDLIQSNKLISIVGTRLISTYGVNVLEQFIPKFVQSGLITVSGLARGVDKKVHDLTIDNAGKTIAVLGSGVDFIYPTTSKSTYQDILDNGGLIISEYIPGTKPTKYTFPLRNRIIAALSPVTLIVEAAKRSGSLITSKYATSYSRTVMALPGSVFNNYSKGTNDLIRYGGAIPVNNVNDILNEYNLKIEEFEQKTIQLSEIENKLLGIIEEKTSLNTIISKTGYTIDKVVVAMEKLKKLSVVDVDEFGFYKKR